MKGIAADMSTERVGAILEATPAALRALFSGFDDEALSWHPAEGEWCVKEVIGHLIEMDRLAFADRIRLLLEQDLPAINRLDANAIAAARHDCQADVQALIEQLSQQRVGYAQFVRGLDLAMLDRSGTLHPYGEFQASDFLYEWPYHDLDHLNQIANNLKAFVWPYMSRTMRRALSE